MNGKEFKYEIKNLISKGKLEKALELGISFSKENEFYLLSSRFHINRNKFNKGIISNEELKTEDNRITISILELVDKTNPDEKLQKKRKRKFLLYLLITLGITDWKKLKIIATFGLFIIATLIGLNIDFKNDVPKSNLRKIQSLSDLPEINYNGLIFTNQFNQVKEHSENKDLIVSDISYSIKKDSLRNTIIFQEISSSRDSSLQCSNFDFQSNLYQLESNGSSIYVQRIEVDISSVPIQAIFNLELNRTLRFNKDVEELWIEINNREKQIRDTLQVILSKRIIGELPILEKIENNKFSPLIEGDEFYSNHSADNWKFGIIYRKEGDEYRVRFKKKNGG